MLVVLPETEQKRRQKNHGVVYEERSWVKRAERPVAVASDDTCHPGHADVRAVRLKSTEIRKTRSIKLLSLASPVKADVRDADDNVVNDSCRGRQRNQPVEYLCRRARKLQQREEGEHHNHGKAVNWGALIRRLGQEARSSALES